jgi:hypothetical protein
VNIGLHQGTKSSINHAMSLHGLLAGESMRKDAHLEVASSVSCAGVVGVAPAVVDDL